jgi:hypothetical protein
MLALKTFERCPLPAWSNLGALGKIISTLGAILVFACVFVNKAYGQTAESLSQVKKVFVDSLGTEKGATDLRDAMIKALRKDGDIQIVATANEADAVITGSGKIWQTGSIRLGPHGSVSQPMYDGYLQVELKGKGDKTLWSQRLTPSSFPWNGVVWDLASHLVKSLMVAIRQDRKVVVLAPPLILTRTLAWSVNH